MIKISPFLACLVLVVLASCKQEPEKVISFDDIVAHSERDYDKDKNQVSEVDSLYYDKLNSITKSFIDSLKISKEAVYEKDTVFFLDRFPNESQIHFMWNEKVSGQEIIYSNWKFKDSLSMMNAFYNALDCMGPNCKPLPIGESIRIQKKEFIYLVGNQEIVYIEGGSKLKNWIERISKYKEYHNWNFIIHQKVKTTWYIFKDLELIPLDKK
jgi:hypothetical protein